MVKYSIEGNIDFFKELNEIQNNDALILTKINMDELQNQIPVPTKLKISTSLTKL